jgi:hypothetical protein
MAELTRAFYLALDLIQNPGEGRNTFIVLTDLQTDDYGLEVGASFQQDGLLKVTLADKPHARGSAATGYVGLVTVSTP